MVFPHSERLSGESSEDSVCGVLSDCSGPSHEEIELNAKSRDDIPALLIGLQAIYTSEAARTERMGILDKHILPARGF